MAMVTVSLDTATRDIVLTIDGVLVSAMDFSVSKYTFDGVKFVSFGYTVDIAGTDGLTERRQFFLPSEDEVSSFAGLLDDKGFASKIVHDDEKAKADVIDFIKQNRNNGYL